MSVQRRETARGLPVLSEGNNFSVLETLSHYIAKSQARIGDRLPAERALAEQLQVGRSSIREALKHWQVLKIVEKRKGSGTYLLAEVSPEATHVSLSIRNNFQDMLLTLEIRRCLETQAAVLTVGRASDEEIEIIEHQLNRMETVHQQYGNAPVEDWKFHNSIYEASHNPKFREIIEGMYDAFHSFFERPDREHFAARSYHLHRKLFEAIAVRNAEQAAQVTHQILDITEEDIKSLINEQKH